MGPVATKATPVATKATTPKATTTTTTTTSTTTTTTTKPYGFYLHVSGSHCSSIRCQDVKYKRFCNQNSSCCMGNYSKGTCHARVASSLPIWMLILIIVFCLGAAVFCVWMVACRRKDGARGNLFDEGASRSMAGSLSGGIVVQTSQTFSALATPVPVVQAVAAEP